MKKSIIPLSILLLVMAVFLLMRDKQEQKHNPSQPVIQETKQNKEKSIVKKEVQKSNQAIEKECQELAENYITKIKTGSSKDIFVDRMEKVKNMISNDLYKKLTPNMSAEEIQQSRKQNEKLTVKDIIKTNVNKIESATREIDDDTFEIYTIYSLQVSQQESLTNARYLMRLKMQVQNNSCKIYTIVEDSELGNGIYK